MGAYGFEETLAPQDHSGRDATVEACSKYISKGHEKPFLLVASLINPHDICYLPLRDFVKASPPSERNTKLLSPAALVEVDAAMRIPAGISEREFYDKHCPPLPDNYAISDKELSSTIPKAGYLGFARANYTDKQWLMYRWAYARLTERVDAQVGPDPGCIGGCRVGREYTGCFRQ